MSKSFEHALQEWIKDNKYVIGEDVGDEYYDYLEAGPMPVDCSLTLNHGTTDTPEA